VKTVDVTHGVAGHAERLEFSDETAGLWRAGSPVDNWWLRPADVDDGDNSRTYLVATFNARHGYVVALCTVDIAALLFLRWLGFPVMHAVTFHVAALVPLSDGEAVRELTRHLARSCVDGSLPMRPVTVRDVALWRASVPVIATLVETSNRQKG
jgi:hypothetical protein